MKKITFVSFFFLLAGFSSALSLKETKLVYGQPPVSAKADTSKPSQQVAPTTLSNVSPATQEPLYNAYNEILKISKDTIKEVHRTANLTLTFISILFTALSVFGSAGAWLFSRYAKSASEKALSAHQLVQSIEAKSQKLEERYGETIEDINRLSSRLAELLPQINTAQSELNNMRTNLAQIRKENERDREAIRRPLALIQIDDYAMRLFADDAAQRESAILALLEMSERSDSIIRRRCVKVFGALDKYNNQIADRLKDMIAKDKANGVRLEAEKALHRLKSKLHRLSKQRHR